MNDKLRSRGQAISADREAAEQYENWMSTFAMNFGNIPDGCSFIDYLEKEIRDRVNELGDDEVTETPHPIERRSPLGLFLRRVTTRLRKLSFSETGHLAVQVGQWCGNEVVRGGLSAAISRRTAMENTSQTRQETMER
jgi:anaphase-promoting complex subunit 5